MPPRPEIALVLPLIRTIRGQRVILDSDLARLYGVSTSRLNQQVRRNERRFPVDFVFQLTLQEAAGLLQFATAPGGRNLSKLPLVYTEHGAIMAANVLNSERAVVMSVEVVRAFVRLRRAVTSKTKLARKVADLERAVGARLDDHDRGIEALFRAVERLIAADSEDDSGRKRIGFLR